MSLPRLLSSRAVTNLLRILVVLTFLAGCQSNNITSTAVSPSIDTRSTETGASEARSNENALAEITFAAQTPTKLAGGQNLIIEFLDEVTGLAINPARARMKSTDGQNFTVKVPILLSSVVKYRYLRDNDPIGVEYTSLGQAVRYRMYSVDGPGIVHDTITAWQSAPASGGFGRIQGQVANKANNAPVVNALVAAGGMQTLTASDGSFLLEGLPAGTHNMVVYSLDGAFLPFQQGAVVAADSTTPALVLLNQSSLVNVRFVVHPPKGHPSGIPLRLIGNIYSLGNTFADLSGGMNVIASRAPLMSLLPDGSYSLSLRLPAGLDLRYKYSLGDGFWNSERNPSGDFNVRQVIVPNKDASIEDTIATWKTGGFAPILFNVTVPENTPVSDTISIQFNPFGWTEPIPMWPAGNNRWFYALYNPMGTFTTANYRFCRNDQCGASSTAVAGDSSQAGAQGKSFSPKSTEQNFDDTISAWAWFDTVSEPVIVSAAPIKARDAGFQAGVEWLPGYQPSWQPYLVWAYQNIKDMGSNTVMLTPTWRLTHKTPPVIEPVAGQDAMWMDMTQMAVQAQKKELAIAIHPVLRFPEDPGTWWQTAARDDGWWQSWFDRYRTFAMYHADLATQTGAKVLVLGDANILPALPGGMLADGSPSGVPADADARWRKLLSDVRTRYTGKLAWMVPYAGKPLASPEFFKDVDILYVQISGPLAKTDQASTAELEAGITAALDTDILKLQETTNHPIILGLQYPSVGGALDGCIESDGTCLAWDTFQRPAPSYPSTELSLKDQANVTSVLLSLLNQRSWIAGFYSIGYNPAVELKDMSTSIRSKPASDVLWYWFPRLLGQR